MNHGDLQGLVSAAEAVLSADPTLCEEQFATWLRSVPDDVFDVETTAWFLREKGRPIDRALLEGYAESQLKAIPLRRIWKVASWIKPLNETFRDDRSLEKLREREEFAGILTFTTPAFSADGRRAFLEVWTENGAHAQMGQWFWVLLNKEESGWTPVWICRYRLS
ncbi:MAG: hypothetical protein AAF514_13010 [Verrucomicrobiota bacterium]